MITTGSVFVHSYSFKIQTESMFHKEVESVTKTTPLTRSSWLEDLEEGAAEQFHIFNPYARDSDNKVGGFDFTVPLNLTTVIQQTTHCCLI